MSLADSSIVIEFSRRPTARVRAIISGEGASVCGVTVAEIYAGCRTAREFDLADSLLGLFGKTEISEPVWGKLGKLLSLLESSGRRVPLADVITAATAIHHDIELWTRDEHHRRIQRLAPS